MKKVKTILALLLVMALVCVLFAACSGSGSGTDKPAANNASEETATIKMAIMDFNSSGGDHGARINEAVNAISVPAINVKAEITFMGMGDFRSKVQTGIAGGERIDLMTALFMLNVNTLHQNGMAKDITDELKEFSPEALAVVGNEIDPYTYDGRYYGLPTHRNLLTCKWIIMNKDVLDELGLTDKAENMTTWSEFEEILQAVKDAKSGSGMFPIISNTGSVFQGTRFDRDSMDTIVFDNLGDNTSTVFTDQEGHVSLLAEQDCYTYPNKLAASWNEKGYIYPDSIINTSLSGNDLVNALTTFSLICSAEYGIQNSTNYEMPIVAKQVSDYMLVTSSLTNMGMAVPITSEDPEAACKFLNLMYTNADLMNILVNGQEGVDYELVDGQASKIAGQYAGGDFIMGNNLLLIPGLGQGADFNEVVKSKMAEMKTSAYLGFNIDITDLSDLIANMSAVNDQYNGSLNGGDFTEDLYNEYLGKLKAAGVEDYLKAVQTQLDAWLAAK